ncbi:MAG: YncE family protein, partial [Pseudomonadota bacterium]|nr:YncE family protein [Pseudomonadota bacterium]
MRWLNASARHSVLALILAALPAQAELAYITCQNGNALSLFDLDSGQETARWSLPGQPAGIAVGADAVFTVAPEGKVVRRHTPITGEITAEAHLDGGPTGIALDEQRGRVFVSDWYNARVWVLDAADLSVQRILETGAAPAGLAVSDDGRIVASADRDTNQVSLFDAETLTLIARITVGVRPYGLR